ncbi:cupredoxin domain-containing protein [Primorskyibacter flagellatus]|nr:cupredoxin family copper-binding protein [Primorskyibacter flagellatus]
MTTRRALIALSAAAVTCAATLLMAADTTTVTIDGFAFSPKKIVVKAGSAVTFVNRDGAPHTATATNGAFDTGNLGKGSEKTVTFDTPGTYGYICSYHPSMKGTVVVE